MKETMLREILDDINGTCPSCNQSHALVDFMNQGLSLNAIEDLDKKLLDQAEPFFRDRAKKFTERSTTKLSKENEELKKALQESEKELQKSEDEKAKNSDLYSSLTETLEDLRKEVKELRRENTELEKKNALKDLEIAIQVEEQLKKQSSELTDKKVQLEVSKARRESKDELEEKENRIKQLEEDKEKMDKKHKQTLEDIKKNVATPINSKIKGSDFEADTYEILKESLPSDRINQMKNGERGADFVIDLPKRGKIIIESKYVTTFSKNFIKKALTDKNAERADLAFIVTTTFPKAKENENWYEEDEIIITKPEYLGDLLKILRPKIIESKGVRLLANEKSQYLQGLWDYIRSPEMKIRTQTIRKNRELMEKSVKTMKKVVNLECGKILNNITDIDQNQDLIFENLLDITGAESELYKEVNLALEE